MIENLVKDDKAKTFEDLVALTGCGTGCGKCRERIKETLSEMLHIHGKG